MGGTVDGPPDVFAPLTQPIEPAGSIAITAEPAPPPAWRTLEIQLCLDASEGHPLGARIILDSNTLVAPLGRAPDAHTFEEPTITMNGEVVDADARIVDDRASGNEPDAPPDDAGSRPDERDAREDGGAADGGGAA